MLRQSLLAIALTTFTLHSQANEVQMLHVDGIANTSIVNYDEILDKAAKVPLEPGRYSISIDSGRFSYGPTFPSEPFLIMFISGGELIKLSNQVITPATWASLNSYSETFEVEITKQSNLMATFLDRSNKNNSGEINLAIERITDIR